MVHSRVAALHLYHGRLSEVWRIRIAKRDYSSDAEWGKYYDWNDHESHFWDFLCVGWIGAGSPPWACVVQGQESRICIKKKLPGNAWGGQDRLRQGLIEIFFIRVFANLILCEIQILRFESTKENLAWQIRSRIVKKLLKIESSKSLGRPFCGLALDWRCLPFTGW